MKLADSLRRFLLYAAGSAITGAVAAWLFLEVNIDSLIKLISSSPLLYNRYTFFAFFFVINIPVHFAMKKHVLKKDLRLFQSVLMYIFGSILCMASFVFFLILFSYLLSVL